MSGDAIIKFASSDSPKSTQGNNGKGIGVDTDLAFSASGELDNGFTVSFSKLLTHTELGQIHLHK